MADVYILRDDNTAEVYVLQAEDTDVLVVETPLVLQGPQGPKGDEGPVGPAMQWSTTNW